MNRSVAALIAVVVGLGMTACGDRESKPVERPVVPPSETRSEAAAPAETTAVPVAAVVAALAPEKTFAEATARIAPLFKGGTGAPTAADATGALPADPLRALQDRLPEVIAYQERALQHAFAPEELAQIAAFVQTPAGQKFVAVLPQLQRETQEFTSRIANGLVGELVRQKVREGAIVAIQPLAPVAQPTAGTAPAAAPSPQPEPAPAATVPPAPVPQQ